MRTWVSFHIVAAGALMWAAALPSHAAETGFSTYGLGGASFGAGVTPPPGTYVTTAVGYYAGNIEGSVTVGNVLVDVALKASFLSVALNGLYVPERKFLGGQPAISVTVPVGYVDLDARATVGPLTGGASTDGPGLGDVVSRVQLGWQHGESLTWCIFRASLRQDAMTPALLPTSAFIGQGSTRVGPSPGPTRSTNCRSMALWV